VDSNRRSSSDNSFYDFTGYSSRHNRPLLEVIMNIGPVLRDEVIEFLEAIARLRSTEKIQLAAKICPMADEFEVSLDRLYWTYRALDDNYALKQLFLRKKGHLKTGGM
jgi:hypothetical protein